MIKYRIGIDIGGTKIRFLILNGAKVVYAHQIPTPEDPEYLYKQLVIGYSLALSAINYEEHTVGVGIPGNVNRPTYIFGDTDPQAEMNRIFGRDVVIENDANCFALAEAKLGAAYGHDNVFGVILGTGVGGGIVLNGELYRGTSGLVAEWGHNILHTGGRDCWCGLKGCYEMYIAGPAIEREYKRAMGEDKHATDILVASDVVPHLIQYEFFKDLATGLASMINILDPQVVVIGGGLSNVKQIYETVPGLVESQLFSKKLTAKIVPAVLTNDAGAIGAALIGK